MLSGQLGAVGWGQDQDSVAASRTVRGREKTQALELDHIPSSATFSLCDPTEEKIYCEA